MIEPMKKLTVVCLKSDQAAALTELRELGVLHVVPSRRHQSEELTELIREKERLQWVINNLSKAREKNPAERSFPEYESLSAKELLERAAKDIHNINWLEEDINNHDRMYEDLLPWGQFDGKLLDDLREKGMDIRLCAVQGKDLPEVPRNICLKVVNEYKGKTYFIAVSPETIEKELPEVSVHLETSLKELEERNEISRGAIKETRGRLQIMSNYLGKLEDEMLRVEEMEELLSNRDGMGEATKLSYINGYIPAKDLENAKEAAKTHGWALQIQEPEADDPEVPTLVKIPKIFNIAKPIFKFLGIMPGYDEVDVSVCVLFFLTLFFGMIIGDAGYGVIFTAIALLAKLKSKKPSSQQLGLNLFLVMSVTTLVWGWFTGTWFAIPHTKLPAFMHGVRYWEWLPESLTTGIALDTQKNMAIQWFCFFLAAFHLSLGRVWKTLVNFKTNKKAALGHVGWGLFVWGNFFTASNMIVGTEFPSYVAAMYGVGAVLIILFGVNWKDIGDILNLPFGFIGSFVDVLSYIRLFAVGLSSYFIAASFNNMGGMVYDLSAWLIPVTALIILFGHVLNIALGFMGVLVHGVRLNTLEFSNHMELGWKGKFYKPFKNKNNENNQ